MRERKRWIALGVTLTLGVASLAGCGTKNTTKDHSTVEESSQNPDTEPTTEQASDAETTIDAELRELENKAQVIKDQLEDGSLSQGDMNQLSAELYALWDDELNSIWKRIKNKLDADAMEALTKEERAWVQEKEKQVKDAGSEWEGGSGQPLAENTEAANLTRERVYVLAEYLK